MPRWKEFESNCTNYLKDKYGNFAEFILQGGSDSTTPDILVKPFNKPSFFIEAKLSPAQCGQFVLFPEFTSNSFTFSAKNISKRNTCVDSIIEHMNNNFNYYKDVTTRGIDIFFKDCENIFKDWIITYYKEKNVKFLITNNFLILPIDKIADFFEITASYRIKKSGSPSLGKHRIAAYSDILFANELAGYPITGARSEDKKMFVSSESDLQGIHFSYQNCDFIFSLKNGEYEIRKLSPIQNPNVIFSIKLKKNIPELDNFDFVHYLSN